MNRRGLTFRGILVLALSVCALLPAAAAAAPWAEREARWKGNVVTIAVSRSLISGAPNISGDIRGELMAAAAIWSRAADVKIRVTVTDRTNVDPAGLKGDGVSLLTAAGTAENLKLFPQMDQAAPATTRIFRGRDGFISEADIALNPFVQFSDNGSPGSYDLRAVLVHEIGHLLGLEHSPSLASVMYGTQERNGALGGLRPIRLSSADIAAIRSGYGTNLAEAKDCCGALTGRILSVPRKARVAIWAEDASTGKLAAAGYAKVGGYYVLGGLESGEYRIWFQAESADAEAVHAGDIKVLTDLAVSVRPAALGEGGVGGMEFLGPDAQIAARPVSFGPGRFSMLFAGGRAFDPEAVSIGFSSPDINVQASLMPRIDYTGGVTAAALRISIGDGIEAGEYSLFTESSGGGRHYLLGAILIH